MSELHVALRSHWSMVVLVVACSLLAAGCGSSSRAASSFDISPASVPASKASHIVVIVMENKEDKEVLGTSAAPYLTSLARRYAIATNSFGIRHPSLPNYLALTSGSTHGISSNCTDCQVRARNIVDQLQERGISWKGYIEDMPRRCFEGISAKGGAYRKKHNPFMYYEDVVKNPARCRKVVPLRELSTDLHAGRLPTFSFIVPNMCNDTHDCDVKAGDRFLSRLVPALMRGLGPDGFLVVTYDEGSSDSGCCATARGGRIATVIAGPDVRHGFRDPAAVSHYGVLATIESSLGLERLGGAADPRHGNLLSVFRRQPHIR
jgi:hypothetical protein